MKKIFMIYLLMATLVIAQEKILFKDVPKDHWAYSAIKNLVDEGIITQDNFDFNGENTVTRYVFAEELNRVFQKLNEEKVDKGNLVILESLVYEFSNELTKIGFDASTFSGKIENMKINIEMLKKKSEETEAVLKELEKRILKLEEKVGI